MSSKTGASADSITGEDDTSERVHIHSIKEMPSRQDDEIAVIFREMRRASELSLEQLSTKLKAPVETLQALETGAILALSDWDETSRIISAYAGLMGLDSRPVLRRIKAQLQARGDKTSPPSEPVAVPHSPPTPAPAFAQHEQPASAPGVPKGSKTVVPPAGPPMPPGAKLLPQVPDPRAAAVLPQSPPSAQAGSRQRAPEKTGKRRRSILGTIVTWLIVLILFAVMGAGVHYAAQNPHRVWSIVNALPDPAPRVIRSIWELVRPLENNGPAPSGSDPKGQKSDKVPSDRPPRAN